MARSQTSNIGAINVKAHPHDDPRTYSDIFQGIFALRTPISIPGGRTALMTSLLPEVGNDAYYGTIVTYMDISTKDTWFDLERMADADEQALGMLVIPQNLKARSRTFYFYLDAKSHLLVFELKNPKGVLSARQMKAYLDGAIALMLKNYTNLLIDTAIVQAASAIQQILKEDHLRKLEIKITLPNNIVKVRAAVEKRLQQQNAQSLRQTIEAQPGKDLKPSKETEDLMRIASTEGAVEATAMQGKRLKYISTEDRPDFRVMTYPANQGFLESLFASAKQFVREIRRRL
jgi:hypothetical protein